ncbi:uncharacterized protein LOC108032948 [Drosophila biarmipes]|uniref:uncharacterized protein LOC108032948 n=1 Tax=Drosophila biarmipes TaxID=125945 RepID=UPI001CDA56EC|nr:uncharacterized protein LOC108032948 [Drosophila biarmipes]
MATNTSESAEMLFVERLQQQSPAGPPTRTCSQQQPRQMAVFSCLARLSPAKCWLLGILLLLTVASSWPSGTSAAPRRARGLHLILEHRHHRPHRHHQQARSARPTPRIVTLPTNQTAPTQCSSMSMTPNISALEEARSVAASTREAVICLTQEYVENMHENDLKGTIKKYSYHDLSLKHPLQVEVGKVAFNNEKDTFEYVNPETVSSIEEELPKIIETLLVLEHLFEKIEFPYKAWHCYFANFMNFFEHNMHWAMRVANQNAVCNAAFSEYNDKHVLLEFGAALETIKVLTVVEHKYEQLIALNPLAQ